MDLFTFVAVAVGAAIFGFYLHMLMFRLRSFSGQIVVEKTNGVLRYSLVVDEDPEKLQYKPSVIFKVVTREENTSYNETN